MLSIRRVLLLWLLAIVLIGVAAAGVVIYRQAQAEANALFDYQLQQTAAALPSEPFSSVLGGHAGDNEGVVIQIWSRDGAQLYYSHPHATLAPRAKLGFSTETTPTGDWRVYSAIVGDNVVQLAQPMAIRDLLAAETAWRTVWPLLILLPVLGIGVWLIVGRGLRPLSRLAQVLEARRPEAVDPLPAIKLPNEIRPVVHALNGLLQRLTIAFDNQKAFVADAAHELRTPLAALRIQAQLLDRAASDQDRREALNDLNAGVARATRLVEQLLSLARAERLDSQEAEEVGEATTDVTENAESTVDLRRIVRECVAAHALVAIDKGVDLGIDRNAARQEGNVCATSDDGPAPDDGDAIHVMGDADALRVMIGNLLDNAVKYTPAGGKVDVWLAKTGLGGTPRAVLDIVDTGPGIPEAERERVFDRFYRSADALAASGLGAAQGSGLGLAIAKRLADRHQAVIHLSDRCPERHDDAAPISGLHVGVTFPLAC